MQGQLAKAKRVVVKIGSALLVDSAIGRLREDWFKAVIEDIAALKSSGKDVVIVSSGAIAMGRKELGLKGRPKTLDESQAAAAVGQIRLAHAYQEALAAHGLVAAQMLVTLGDTEERRRYLNARTTLETLLKFGAIPVINENDTVATQEIRYGDNDRLAARVAVMAAADCLILLSDIDGLYTADPNSDPGAVFIPDVPEITPAIEAMGGSARSGGVGSGGMATKITAAKIAVAGGCRMAITSGHVLHPIRALADGGRATWFAAANSPKVARKRWISGLLRPAGALQLDAGAVTALRDGRSLLPAGVHAVEGPFDRGDAVRLLDDGGREIGRGLVAYGAKDARAIMGRQSAEIAEIIGTASRDVMIHRDDLVLD
ncbi:glutamate 5-kinase [Govanella unica]|uniref:Glutamate 5-kinase n=1 Tax=Govanella unica TaxID=2975056 RepID=A0A9X3TW66_9PROT|nr:glutamate 5-kinase [Govania unica]MDA5192773.1 glutamate 5-kinase [Govania unica]